MSETLLSPTVLTRENDNSFIAPAAIEAGAAIVGPAVKGPVEIPTLVTSYGDYQRTFGTTFASGSNKYEYLTSIAAKSYFSQGGGSLLVTRVVTGSYSAASNTFIDVAEAGITAQPFQLETLGQGSLFNNANTLTGSIPQNSDGSLVSGSEDNLRWEITNVNNANGTFALSIRRGDDSTKNKLVLESFSNLSLDPNADNYVEKVVGNQIRSKTSDGDGGWYIDVSGEYVNRSKYVRVSAVNVQTLNYLGNDGVSVNTDGTYSYSGSLPIAQSGSFFSAAGDLITAAGGSVKFFGDIDSTNTQGLQPAEYADAFALLENKDEYVFNIVSAPGLCYNVSGHSAQLDTMISLAETRGDCIAVVDVYNKGASVSNVAGAAASLNSSYAATYWPWLQTQSATGKLEWIPASTVIPGLYAFTMKGN